MNEHHTPDNTTLQVKVRAHPALERFSGSHTPEQLQLLNTSKQFHEFSASVMFLQLMSVILPTAGICWKTF